MRSCSSARSSRARTLMGSTPSTRAGCSRAGRRYYPATPHGVQQLLIRSGNDPGGKAVVITGRSTLVGLPLALMLLQKRAGANATVTVCHTATRDLGSFTRRADILVAAAGQPGMITADMVKPGAVVIDVGVPPRRRSDPQARLPLGGGCRLRGGAGAGGLHHSCARRRGAHDRRHAAHQRRPRGTSLPSRLRGVAGLRRRPAVSQAAAQAQAARPAIGRAARNGYTGAERAASFPQKGRSGGGCRGRTA